QKVLDNWSQKGVHSHFHGYLPAALSDLPGKKLMAKMVGAKESEVAILNALTVNLHLLLATFYRPDQKRHKLIIEEHAFPSDTVRAMATWPESKPVIRSSWWALSLSLLQPAGWHSSVACISNQLV